MKVLLFGKNGQVGWELNRALQPFGDVIALGKREADFSNPECLRYIVSEIKPDVIVNSAAYTAVDKAEEEESFAAIINSGALGILAEEALKSNALLVHFSTDYVFNGEKNSPYKETDATCPINVYGRTKLAGEEAIRKSGCDYLIFRTSWVYASRGHNFLLTILKLAKERDELSIVSDQVGAPTSARLIAQTTFTCIHQAMLKKQEGEYCSGLYHLTASGSTSWHGFACAIVALTNKISNLKLGSERIKAISTKEYPTPAKRPKNSRLMLNRLETDYQVVMHDWSKGLKLFIDDIYQS